MATKKAIQETLRDSIADAMEMKELFKTKAPVSDMTTIQTFLESGKSNTRFKDFVAVSMGPGTACSFMLIAPDGRMILVVEDQTCDENQIKRIIADWKKYESVETSDGCVALRQGKLVCIKNGDSEGGDIVGLESEPTISFSCLARFLSKHKITMPDIVHTLNEGEVLDYTQDEVQKFVASRDQKTDENGKKKTIPPAAGFVLVGTGNNRKWHRSGAFLFRHKNQTILLGVDEDTYFGCELAEPVKTVAQAYESLVPKHIRKLPYIRQGEWFAITVNHKDVPPATENLVHVDLGDGIGLPKVDPDSNVHQIFGDEIRVTPRGVFARNFSLEHDDHNSISGSGWYTFVRNTALRSFSQEGVD